MLLHVNCLIYEVNFQKIFLFYLWVLLCFKVGDNGVFVPCDSAALGRVQILVQIKSILSL